MKIEIDDSQLVEAIVDKVVAKLKPLLKDPRSSKEDDTLFTVETLSKYLHVSKQWVYERIHLNEIPFIKMKKFPRFRKCAIDEWLNGMRTPAIQHLSKKLRIINQPNIVGSANNSCKIQ